MNRLLWTFLAPLAFLLLPHHAEALDLDAGVLIGHRTNQDYFDDCCRLAVGVRGGIGAHGIYVEAGVETSPYFLESPEETASNDAFYVGLLLMPTFQASTRLQLRPYVGGGWALASIGVVDRNNSNATDDDSADAVYYRTGVRFRISPTSSRFLKFLEVGLDWRLLREGDVILFGTPASLDDDRIAILVGAYWTK